MTVIVYLDFEPSDHKDFRRHSQEGDVDLSNAVKITKKFKYDSLTYNEYVFSNGVRIWTL